MAAAEAARRLGRPDLLAETCLIAEGRAGAPELLGQLHALAEEALADLDPDDHALRARLLGQLAVTAFYVDPAATEPLSREALAEADIADDPLAIVAAVRARQMCLIEPQHAAERLALAARMGADRAGARPTDRSPNGSRSGASTRCSSSAESARHGTSWSSSDDEWPRSGCRSRDGIWRVWRRCSQTPSGRFDEAIAWSERARDLFEMLEDERGRGAIHLTFLLAVQRHVGYDADTVGRIVDFDYHEAPAFLGDLPALAPIQALAGIGDLEQARARYDRLASPTSWVAPPFLRFAMTVLRMELAVALDRHDDLPPLHHSARGPPRAARRCDGRRRQLPGLRRAVARRRPRRARRARRRRRRPPDRARRRRSAPRRLRSPCSTAAELATTLAARGEPGDGEEAALLASTWRPEALRLGMQPWVTRLDAVTTAASPVERGPLSARELEVAELVSRGLHQPTDRRPRCSSRNEPRRTMCSTSSPSSG